MSAPRPCASVCEHGGRRCACPLDFAPSQRFAGVRYTRPSCSNMTSLPENGALAPSRGASRRCSPRARPRRTPCASTSTRRAISSFPTCRPRRAIARFPAWVPTSRAGRAPPARARPHPQAFPRSTRRRSARATTCGARSSRTSFPQRKSFSLEARALYANGAPVPLPEEQSNAAKYQERIARLRQSVQLHERNIEALKKELGEHQVGRASARRTHRRRTASTASRRGSRATRAGGVKLRFFPSSATAHVANYPGLELLAAAVLMLRSDERVTYVNPAAENLFELSRQKFMHHTPRELFGECPGLTGAIAKATMSGASYTEQEIELGVSGKSKLHLTCTVSPIDTHDAALLVEFRHIDQQLKIAREERLLEQQQANRDLIRSLAHEIKNPLGGIRGAAQLLEGELDRPQLSRIHAGDHRRGRSAAGARQSPAHAEPAADLQAHQHPRDPGARAQRGAGGVSDDPDAARLRHQHPRVRRRPGSTDAGRAQHREERRAGRDPRDAESRDPDHDARRARRHAR